MEGRVLLLNLLRGGLRRWIVYIRHSTPSATQSPRQSIGNQASDRAIV